MIRLDSPIVALVAWAKVGRLLRASAIVEDLDIVRAPEHLRTAHRRFQRLPRTLRVLAVQDCLALIRKERERAISRAKEGKTALLPENQLRGFPAAMKPVNCRVAS